MLIVFYQYWLVNCNTCTTQMQDVKNRENREEEEFSFRKKTPKRKHREKLHDIIFGNDFLDRTSKA